MKKRLLSVALAVSMAAVPVLRMRQIPVHKRAARESLRLVYLPTMWRVTVKVSR